MGGELSPEEFPFHAPLNLQAYSSRLQALSSNRASALPQRGQEEPFRADHLILQTEKLWVDATRSQLSLDALAELFEFATFCKIAEWRRAMFTGKTVNVSEGRAALHWLMRSPSPAPRPLSQALQTAAASQRQTLSQMGAFAESVRNGHRRGSTGRLITDILHLGCGGSHLGPALGCSALASFAHPRLKCHFLSNVDPQAWDRLTKDLQPATTIVSVASKSWQTTETRRNAEAARRWLTEGGISSNEQAPHWVGITENLDAAREFGIPESTLFHLPKEVGGRFSIWSSVGLPLMLLVGPTAFQAMLDGAHEMDQHFIEAPHSQNLPVLLALLSFWNSLASPGATEVLIPYCDALRKLPLYVQQLQMESNGKQSNLLGEPITYATTPAVWGGVGTEAQHSFFQALHQGTYSHAVELIIVPGLQELQDDPEARSVHLLANALAQTEALFSGSSSEQCPPHQHCPGNRPCTVVGLSRLDPAHFGALLALYEHRTTTLGWLWQINPFDQWGVEEGKRLASRLEPFIRRPAHPTLQRFANPPSSLRPILEWIHAMQQNP